jgi:hypothetical protein
VLGRLAPRADPDQAVEPIAIQKLGAVFVAVIERPFAERASPQPPRLLSSRDAQLPLNDLTPLFRLTPSRINDNELILFDQQARESWIIYPPRSAYDHVERADPGAAVVEHHPWAPLSEPVFHTLTPAEGCAEHGLECGASAALKAGAELGWNAFS